MKSDLIVLPKSSLGLMNAIENTQNMSRCQKCCDCTSPRTTGTVVAVAADVSGVCFHTLGGLERLLDQLLILISQGLSAGENALKGFQKRVFSSRTLGDEAPRSRFRDDPAVDLPEEELCWAVLMVDSFNLLLRQPESLLCFPGTV